MTSDNNPENTAPPQPPARQPPARQPLPEITAGAPVLPLVPKSFDEVLRYARMVLLAGAVPDSLSKENGRQLPENEIVARVVAVIAAGSEVHMPPMAAMAWIALVNKKRVIWGQGAVAVLQASGQLEDMKVERIGQEPGASITTAQFPDTFAIKVSLKRKGIPTPFVGTFSVGQAKRAHLWMNASKKPWVEHPERMLLWRAFHNAASTGFGDSLAGLVIREVADDMTPPPQQITDTSFLDAPSRREVVPDTVEPAASNEAQAPVEPGPMPDDDIPPFPGDLPSAEASPAPSTETPTPTTRRARRPRHPPGEELHFEPPPEPDERENEDDREPPDPDVQ